MHNSVQRYTEEFTGLVFALAPASLLDIGCGQGDFIFQAQQSGIRVAGVDTNTERVAAARDRGLDVRKADRSIFHLKMARSSGAPACVQRIISPIWRWG